MIDLKDWTIGFYQDNELFLLISPNKNKGVVLSLSEGKLYNEFNINSILARGYWEEYKGGQEILPKLLSKIKEIAD